MRRQHATAPTSLMAPLLVSMAFLFFTASAEAGTPSCPEGGPSVKSPVFCKYFRKYSALGTNANERISRNLHENPQKVRSIALLVGVDNYKNKEWNIPPAAKDIQMLEKLLIEDQKFDEVIVLQNGDATKEVILYFINEYIPSQLDLYEDGKTRVLFAYSGHGSAATNKGSARLVLSGASRESDPGNTIEASLLNTYLTELGRKSFHLLALINACYGGDLFGLALTGSSYDVEEKGAYAITGPNDSLAWGLDKHNSGSILFEKLVAGIQTGKADEKNMYLASNGIGKTALIKNDFIRLGKLHGYLVEEIQELGKNPKTGKGYGLPWLGSISYRTEIPLGAFFFLPPKQASIDDSSRQKLSTAQPNFMLAPNPTWVKAALDLNTLKSTTASGENRRYHLSSSENDDATSDHRVYSDILHHRASPNAVDGGKDTSKKSQTVVNIRNERDEKIDFFGVDFNAPSGSINSIEGHPEIKIFNPPESYGIHGVDISQFNEVDWPTLVKLNRIGFVYIRATGIRGVDRSFKSNWEQAEKLHTVKGAYHYWSYCQSNEEQLERIGKTVHLEEGDLPIAINLEWPPNSRLTKEVSCAKDLGDHEARLKVESFIGNLKAMYGQPPIVYGDANVFNTLLSASTDDFGIWLGDSQRKAIQVNLAGHKSWTFWQHEVTPTIPGVKGSIDRNVFYGTRPQFEALLHKKQMPQE